MRDFVRTWGAGILGVLVVGTAFTIWGFTAVSDTGQRLAILGIYVPPVLTLLVEGRKRAIDREGEVKPDPPFLQAVDARWRRLTTKTKRSLAVVVALFVVCAAIWLTDSLLRGQPTESRLSPSAVTAEAGRPVIFIARQPPGSQDYLYIRVLVLPSDGPGLCASSNSSVSYTPVLDGDMKKYSEQVAPNNELVRLAVGGPHDSAAVSVRVDTSPGCRVNLSIKESYYRSKGIWP